MKEFQNYFEVTPRIVPADQESTIRITPLFDHAELPPADRIKVRFFPVGGLFPDGTSTQAIDGEREDISIKREGKSLLLKARFAGEQEHCILLDLFDLPGFRNSDEWVEKEKKGIRFNVYSLRPDLYRLRPFKGDFHVHSVCSDGAESPEYVAARYRQMGFDFMAVTDHRRYEPSRRTMEYWKSLNNGFRLYPGEEVHSPDNPVHIIHFGGSYSINEKAFSDEQRYRKEAEEILRTIPPEDLPSGLDPFPVAASEWVFREIRKAGGLSVFCHPYWQTNKYEICEALSDAVFRRGKFDAFELLGGFYEWQWRSNACQIARYGDERAQGHSFPVVGLSDSHGTDCEKLADWNCTVILAESERIEDLISGVRNGTCAAVERINEAVPHVFGEFRMVKYISFLVENYFPAHRELCSVEGALMLEALAGCESARKALDELGNRVAVYREKAFARS